MPIISNFPGGSGTGGGLALAAATNIKTLTAHEKVYIQWTDPDDLIVAGSTLASWGGTLLVRKAGSMPTSRRDGVIVLDSKTRDAYKTTYFCDSGLTDGTTYYYKLFPYTTANAYTDAEEDGFSATPDAVALGDVSGLTLEAVGNGKLAIKWTDPAASIANDGVTLATWASTIVVVKAGGYASSPTDPDAAYTFTSTTRNAYAANPLVATGLTNGTTYYVSLFPMSTDGKANTSTANRKSGIVDRITISSIPSQNGSLTYTGNLQVPVWSGYDSSKMAISGDTTGMNAGTYQAAFTPADDYMWPDGTTTPKTVEWNIGRATIAAVPSPGTALTYNGAEQTQSFSGYVAGQMTIDKTAEATDAGTYRSVFTPTGNYQWPDGSTESKTVQWTIARAALTVPSQNGSLTYNGSAQSPSWSNYDGAKMTIGGATSGTNAGNYSATFTPTANYQWSDGSATAKTAAWSIGKAAGSLFLNKTSLSLTTSAKTGTITVTRSGNGTITATSSNTGVATVSVSGTTVTVTGVANGSATITVKVAAGTNHTAPSNKTVSVSVQLVPALNDCTWAQISEVSAKGQGANYWNIGDRKAILIKGMDDTIAINEMVYVYIIGFNHNSTLEGTGIQFGTFKDSSGKDICLADAEFGANHVRYNEYDMKVFNVNHWGSKNFGGWKACDMRYDLLGSTNKPPLNYGKARTSSDYGYDASKDAATNPVEGTLMAALPSDLRAVMKPITKYSDNVGNGSGFNYIAPENISTSIDYLPLMSEYEVYGSSSYGNNSEKNYQKQYAFYIAGNSKIKYWHEQGDPMFWWTRSIYSDYTFVVVKDNGGNYSCSSSVSYGLAPIFMV